MKRPMLALLAAAATAAAARAETGVTDSEILFGSCAQLSQDLGKAELAGCRAYIEHVNELGGVHGRKIRLLSLDDKFTPEGAKECYDRLMQAGVFATGCSAGAAPNIQYTKFSMANKVPYVGSTSSKFMYEPVKRYVFNVRATFTQETYGLAKAIHDNLGMRRFAAIYMADVLGFDGVEGVKDFLASKGLSLVASESFLRTATDMKAQVEAVRAAKPQVVFIIGNYRQAAMVLKQAKDASWRPLFAFATSRPGISKEAGEAAEGLVMAELFPNPERADLPAVALFHQAMKKHQPEAVPDIKALEGFAHAMLLVEGLKRAGPALTREKLVDAFEAMRDVDLGLGPEFKVSFSTSNHQGFQTVGFGVVRGGRLVTITDWKSVKP